MGGGWGEWGGWGGTPRNCDEGLTERLKALGKMSPTGGQLARGAILL